MSRFMKFVMDCLTFAACVGAVVGVTALFVDKINEEKIRDIQQSHEAAMTKMRQDSEVRAADIQKSLDSTVQRYEIQLGLLKQRLDDLKASWDDIAHSCNSIAARFGSRLVERRKEMDERLRDAQEVNAEIQSLLSDNHSDGAKELALCFAEYEESMVQALDWYAKWHAASQQAFADVSRVHTDHSVELRDDVDAVLLRIDQARPVEASSRRQDGDDD